MVWRVSCICDILHFTVLYSVYIKPVFALPLRRQIIATDGVSGLFRGLSLNIVGVFPTRYLNRIQLCIVHTDIVAKAYSTLLLPWTLPGAIAQSPTTLEISAIKANFYGRSGLPKSYPPISISFHFKVRSSGMDWVGCYSDVLLLCCAAFELYTRAFMALNW